MSSSRRGILYVSAVIVAVAPPVVWLFARPPAPPRGTVVVPVAFSGPGLTKAASHRSKPLAAKHELEALARRDPLALARLGHQRYRRQVRDYRCVLAKQERIDGKLSLVEEVEVRFRDEPRAVYMLWRLNASQARRALFKDDPAFVDDQGRKLARVEPAGSVVRLFVRDVYLPIDGEQARKVSRRTIEECGFGATFELLERFNKTARKNGVLDVRFAGTGEVDRRPTYVITRHLPYQGEGGPYPDAKLVLHLDQEWLLPVAVESFADEKGEKLLGRYVFKQVELNPGLTDADFEF